MALWRVEVGGRPLLARGPADAGPSELLAAEATIDGLLGGGLGALAELLKGPATGPVPAGARTLVPVGSQPVWAAGVTFARSRDARLEGSRSLPDLVDWLWRGQELPLGVVLLSGTSIVPPPELTLRPGDRVAIAISGLGELRNPVELVDTTSRPAAPSSR